MPLLLPIFLLIGAEIWILIEVGAALGPGLTLILLVMAVITGGAIIRNEGFSAARRMNEAAMAGESPATEIMTSFARLLAGLLLIFPGFLSDALAVALLLPSMRNWIVRIVLPGLRGAGVRRGSPRSEATSPKGRSTGRVIEGESNRIGD